MTITELIDELTDALDTHGDLEVMLAWQPNWPLQAHIATVTTVNSDTVYLAQGDQPDDPYAPAEAWEGGDIDTDHPFDDDAA